MKRQVLLLGVLFLAFTSPARAEVRYTVTDLIAIWEASFPEPERVKTWYASAINNHGQIAGYAETTDNSVFALVWDEANGLRDFSDLEGASWTYAINNLGQVTIGGSTPAVWDPGTGLREIVGSVDPIGINDRGQVVGKYRPTSDGMSHAFVWQDGAMRDLGNLGGEVAVAHGVNNAGQVVGWCETLGWAHAFVWDAENGMRDLGSLGRGSLATDINDLGQTAGYSAFEEGGCHACLWEKGEMIDIDTLGSVWSGGFSINDTGQVVGQFELAEDDYRSVFLWDSIDGMRDLQGLIQSDADWRIFQASGINDAGWIVGIGMSDVGAGYPESRAILLIPVPEPSGIILLFGLLLMLPAGRLFSHLSVLRRRPAVGRGLVVLASLVVVLAGLRGRPACAAEVRYTVTDLSAIWEASFPEPQRVKRWFASAINNHGQIAGYAETTDNSSFALVWDEANGLRDFSYLEGASEAYGINNLGQLPLSGSTPALWDPRFGLQLIVGFVSPTDVNDLGQVVGIHWPDLTLPHAFIWENGVLRDLGNLGEEEAEAFGVNGRGQVVGYSERPGWAHAFLWDAENSMQDLGSFGRGSLATDINDLGQIVGYSAYENEAGAGRHACLWENDQMIDIDPLGALLSGASAINNLGQVVGNLGGDSAFIWDRSDGIVNLNDLIATEPGWTIAEAYDINDKGWIVAAGLKDVGSPYPEARAVLLRPVPEPSGIVLIAGIAVGTLSRLLWGSRFLAKRRRLS